MLAVQVLARCHQESGAIAKLYAILFAAVALYACLIMTCAFPIIAVTAQTTATVSEPDRLKSDCFLKLMTRAFF